MWTLPLAVAIASTFVLKAEPNHTTIGFIVPIAAGMTKVTGKFTRFDVELVYDAEEVARFRVKADIDASSIDTGIDDRDADLRGESFFDVARHPRILFESENIERRGDGYVAKGTLTMRGHTRPLELPFRVTSLNWHEGAPMVGVASEIAIDRNEYGIGSDWRHTLFPNFIGDDVEVEIFLWTRPGKRLEPENERSER